MDAEARVGGNAGGYASSAEEWVVSRLAESAFDSIKTGGQAHAMVGLTRGTAE
jgi:hypothetical protein